MLKTILFLFCIIDEREFLTSDKRFDENVMHLKGCHENNQEILYDGWKVR